MVVKRCAILAMTVFSFSILKQSRAQNDALATTLNKKFLSPIPAGLSTYKPGTLVVVRAGGNPDPQPLDTILAAMAADEATATLPSSTIKTANDFSIAATLFGWTAKPSLSRSTTLQTDQMALKGWVLNATNYANILDPKSNTFQAAVDVWRNRLGFRNSHLYIIDSVYTTTHVKVTSSNSLDVAVGVACKTASATGDSTNSGGNTANTQNATKPPATANQTPNNKQQSTTNNDNPVATDVQAVGTETANIINAVDGHSSTNSSGSGGNSSSTKTGTSTTNNVIGNLFKNIEPSVSICHTSNDIIQIDSLSPVPVAMVLKEVFFEANYSKMILIATNVKW